MRAGREIRVIVDPGEVDDERAALISHEIAAAVEKEMELPGPDQDHRDPREPRDLLRQLSDPPASAGRISRA